MSKTLGIFVLATLLSVANSSLLSGAPVVAYVDRITQWWGCNVPAQIGLPSGPTTGANVIALSFWTSTGPADAAVLWTNLPGYIPDNCGYGTTNEQMRDALLQKYHQNGVKVIVAAFGATDYPTSKDPTEVCTNLAKFVLENKLDGVDLDYEDSGAFERGIGARWLITCTKVLRQYLPVGQYILTHAPQGPYFTTASLYPDRAYLAIDEEVGQLIDWHNLQYYNQGSGIYESYEDTFVGCRAFPGTAVLELKGLKSKIVIGKPVTAGDANNGWVDTSTLGEWLKKANRESGWCGGAMYWQLSSDANGSFGSTMKNALSSLSGCSQI